MWKITMPEQCPDPSHYVNERFKNINNKNGAAKCARFI
jgi:hypothetical protein